jgi:hypothetical protein
VTGPPNNEAERTMVNSRASQRVSQDLARALARDDRGALVALARERPGRVVRFLTGRLCVTAEPEKWAAVRALGTLAREPGLLTDARVHDLLQRFLWALNDESGAVPYGVPEAMGEILAARPEHRAAMLPILCGMLTEQETFQTGAVERGIFWALGRVGPDVLTDCPEALDVVAAAARSHPDAQTRATAAETLAAFRPSDLEKER